MTIKNFFDRLFGQRKRVVGSLVTITGGSTTDADDGVEPAIVPAQRDERDGRTGGPIEKR